MILTGVSPSTAGGYTVVVSNDFGMVTSAVAVLTVETHTNATILVQPYGDTVPAGGFFQFSVVAAGVEPLRYQWFFQGTAIAEATNRHLDGDPAQRARGPGCAGAGASVGEQLWQQL